MRTIRGFVSLAWAIFGTIGPREAKNQEKETEID